MKRKAKIVIVLLFLLCLAGLLAISMQGKGYRGKIISFYKMIVTDPQIDLTQYPNFEDNPTDWFQQNGVIVHGLGQIEEFTTTNSKEAFERSLQDGNRVFEADISLTLDGKAVLSHEFDGFTAEGTIPTYEEFMQGKVEGKYTTLSMEWIVTTLVQEDEIYIMTDCKADDLQPICEQIVQQAKELGREDVLKRVIVQVYSEEDILGVQEVYPFENLLYSTYKSGYLSQKEIAELCLKYRIPVVTQGAMKGSERDIRYFKEKNIKSFAFTVNSEELKQSLLQVGYQGIYSDSLDQE